MRYILLAPTDLVNNECRSLVATGRFWLGAPGPWQCSGVFVMREMGERRDNKIFVLLRSESVLIWRSLEITQRAPRLD